MPLFRRSNNKGTKRPGTHDVHEVFTPTTPAELNYVARPALDSQLADVLHTPGKQLIVYGESGSGKTTLLRNKLAELDYEYISTPCSASMSYEQLILDAFDQLDPYYIQNKERKRSVSISPSVAADFKLIKGKVEANRSNETGEVRARVLPPQLTPQRLAAFLGELEMCWIIEDFHKIREDQKILYSQCLKVFSDLSVKYRKTKTITIGATETARQVVQYDPEMRRRVSELLVPLMEPSELQRILLNGGRLLNIFIRPAVMDQIVGYSSGLAAMCHQIALNICRVRKIDRTQSTRVQLDMGDLEPAMALYVSELSDTIQDAFDRAGVPRPGSEPNDSTRILAALASGPVSGMYSGVISKKISARFPAISAAKVSACLKELAEENRGGLVRRGKDGTYRFSEPIYSTYAKTVYTEAPAPDATVRQKPQSTVRRGPVSPSNAEQKRRQEAQAAAAGFNVSDAYSDNAWPPWSSIEELVAKGIFRNITSKFNARVDDLDTDEGVPNQAELLEARRKAIAADLIAEAADRERDAEQEDHD